MSNRCLVPDPDFWKASVSIYGVSIVRICSKTSCPFSDTFFDPWSFNHIWLAVISVDKDVSDTGPHYTPPTILSLTNISTKFECAALRSLARDCRRWTKQYDRCQWDLARKAIVASYRFQYAEREGGIWSITPFQPADIPGEYEGWPDAGSLWNVGGGIRSLRFRHELKTFSKAAHHYLVF